MNFDCCGRVCCLFAYVCEATLLAYVCEATFSAVLCPDAAASGPPREISVEGNLLTWTASGMPSQIAKWTATQEGWSADGKEVGEAAAAGVDVEALAVHIMGLGMGGAGDLHGVT